ncbi:hypothetical protein FIBSPDRAFT_903680 [Athelia psychrophila]|uniref:Uncharacterized protein n=1 Tax=Athelia psychrophila TaxID=1759441 RepID=A0A167VNP7_9AGAM|nr:hypothetical protein FIBSPDRAFT_903680 [Fibularhizoctonia sp. CBS 109695]
MPERALRGWAASPFLRLVVVVLVATGLRPADQVGAAGADGPAGEGAWAQDGAGAQGARAARAARGVVGEEGAVAAVRARPVGGRDDTTLRPDRELRRRRTLTDQRAPRLGPLHEYMPVSDPWRHRRVESRLDRLAPHAISPCHDYRGKSRGSVEWAKAVTAYARAGRGRPRAAFADAAGAMRELLRQAVGGAPRRRRVERGRLALAQDPAPGDPPQDAQTRAGARAGALRAGALATRVTPVRVPQMLLVTPLPPLRLLTTPPGVAAAHRPAPRAPLVCV